MKPHLFAIAILWDAKILANWDMRSLYYGMQEFDDKLHFLLSTFKLRSESAYNLHILEVAKIKFVGLETDPGAYDY